MPIRSPGKPCLVSKTATVDDLVDEKSHVLIWSCFKACEDSCTSIVNEADAFSLLMWRCDRCSLWWKERVFSSSGTAYSIYLTLFFFCSIHILLKCCIIRIQKCKSSHLFCVRMHRRIEGRSLLFPSDFSLIA
jgi:hypothetical protein